MREKPTMALFPFAGFYIVTEYLNHKADERPPYAIFRLPLFFDVLDDVGFAFFCGEEFRLFHIWNESDSSLYILRSALRIFRHCKDNKLSSNPLALT